MEILSPGYWQEQDLELGTLAPLGEAISSTVWSSPDLLASQDSQPWTSDETVVAGGTVVLKCQVKDHEDSSLQWSNPAQQTLYFGEKRALRDNRIQLVRSTPHELSISISNVALADEGEYTCSIFTMPVRTAKSLVTVLGIPQKPIISGYKSSLREKETTTLNCQSSGSKPAAQLTWRKGDQELHGEPTRVQEDPNGKTFTVSSSVTFQVSRDDDGADIVCSVNHESLKGADRSTSQRIEVLYTPTAKIRPDPPHPREGQKLLLHCEGRGNPVPQQYLWEKEGSVPPLKMTQESALIFPFLNKSDSGTYGCTATSNMGSYKAYYTLNVNDPSPVPSSSSTYHAIIGGIVAFIVFLLLILLIFLGHYLIRHKGTYLTHEAKGSDDAPDADTAIINAEGGQSGGDDKKEYFI
ncbi:cell adhesion molecule 3 isoform X1 [Panthera tigris]|uniref:cell adhesion molecule 3 n=1 Tax=Panthera onca TaxID=9690 RepID=UPI000904C67A|nr:cell adhesion molecule 3 isoform X1 [Panthera leo]XP_042832672.1 cell adhesion molecule 3 isoform X1 [Panthera tigris]XP_060500557.1 cell adhesion molecule 3 [Panthera onca]